MTETGTGTMIETGGTETEIREIEKGKERGKETEIGTMIGIGGILADQGLELGIIGSLREGMEESAANALAAGLVPVPGAQPHLGAGGTLDLHALVRPVHAPVTVATTTVLPLVVEEEAEAVPMMPLPSHSEDL